MGVRGFKIGQENQSHSQGNPCANPVNDILDCGLMASQQTVNLFIMKVRLLPVQLENLSRFGVTGTHGCLKNIRLGFDSPSRHELSSVS